MLLVMEVIHFKFNGEIHSDFERGFIRADVISYSDFIIGNDLVPI